MAMMKHVKIQRINNKWNLLARTKVKHQKLKEIYPDELYQIMEVVPK